MDGFIPSLNLVVEYDGWYWHEGCEERDVLKTRLLEAEGYRVVRVREWPLEQLEGVECVAFDEAPTMEEVVEMVAARLAAASG